MINFILMTAVILVVSLLAVGAMLWVLGGAMKDIVEDAWKNLK